MYESGSFIWLFLLGISAATFWMRLIHLETPSVVVWDETHFGKMLNGYIKGEFFFDVHPPLGKLLYVATANLIGDNGSETFAQPGDEYNSTVYVALRRVSAISGSLVVPFGSLAVFSATNSFSATVITSLFLLFDSALLTISQYILLDSFLLVFQCAALVAIFNSIGGKRDYLWLFLLGVFLMLHVSIKLSGVLLILYAGLFQLDQLWALIGDKCASITFILSWVLKRCCLLVLIPTAGYCAIFWIHFHLLNKSGPGDGFFSGRFQSSLLGNPLHGSKQAKELHCNSDFTIKSLRRAGAYLHSHGHLFPSDIAENAQQVTGYFHRDSNNHWSVIDEACDSHSNNRIVHGSLIRIYHINTRTFLSTISAKSSLGHNQYLVMGTIESEEPSNDRTVWKIEVVNQIRDVVSTGRTKVRIVNGKLNCALNMNPWALPSWGFDQNEVSCSKKKNAPGTLWMVEENDAPNTPQMSYQEISLGYFTKLLEIHDVMFGGNSQLRPREGDVTSKPWEWPFNLKGQPFSEKGAKVHLKGTSLIWNFNLIILSIFPLVYVVICGTEKRQRAFGVKFMLNTALLHRAAMFYIGWIIHYGPFFLMRRVLYFHHYLPAFLFSCMISGSFLAWMVSFIGVDLLKIGALVCVAVCLFTSWLENYKEAYGL